MSWEKTFEPRLIEAVRAETRGESVRWAGRPHSGRALWQSLAIWLVAIPWTAFSLGMFGTLVAAVFFGNKPLSTVSVFEGLVAGIMLVFMVPFVAIGLYMLAMPFRAWWLARHTAYVLTDRRLMSVSAFRHGVKVSSVMPDRIATLERNERSDGTGTLKVVTGYDLDSDGDKTAKSLDLFAVPEVRRVERLLREMRERRAA